MAQDPELELTRNSYYEASVTRPPASAALAGATHADVCVVGGGYAGLSAALELAERGYAVALLEAQQVGWGASGRNGGQALVGFGFAGQEAIEVQFSPADAQRAWEVSVDAMQLLHARIARHAIACDYVAGHLMLAVNARKARTLNAWGERVARAYGYALQAIGPHEMGGRIASTRFHSALFDPQSGHLHPLKFCLGLADAARAAGVRIYENSPVVAVERGDKPLVRTPVGELRCGYVVLAGNVYVNDFGHGVAPELTPRIMPVGTYIVTTEPMAAARADALIRDRAAAHDTNLILDYFRVTADNRLLFGGGESYTTRTPRNLASAMRQRMLGVFPQLADLAVPHAWGGFVDITLNQAPDFGRVDCNVYYVQGFSGHGLAMTLMAGKLVAEAIIGHSGRFDLMSHIRHRRFPGGRRLRMPALVLGMLYYRLRDLL